MTEPIIDAHHHIWRLEATPWLSGPPVPRIFGEYAALRRDYPIEAFLAEARPAGVVGSVFVQVNVAPGGEVEEVAFAREAAERGGGGCPQAITCFADLADPDAGRVLDRALEASGGRLRAVRQQIHWHEKPLYRFAPRPDMMNDAGWRRGLGEVERRGLHFELQVFPGQMRDAVALVRAFPRTTFVLLHAGMLEDRSPEGWAAWRWGMRDLAACPNLVTKLSGLGTFERACSVALWRPVVEETVALLGPSRCMFGSNFPIESLWTTYAELVETMRACLARLGAEERGAVLHGTAARIYRVQPGTEGKTA